MFFESSLCLSASPRVVDFAFFFQTQIKLAAAHCNSTVVRVRNDLREQSLYGGEI